MNDEQKLSELRGMVAGISALLTSVIATHPKYQDLQLHLAHSIDSGLLDRIWGPKLTAHEYSTCLSFLEALQQAAELQASMNPLASLALPVDKAGT